MTNYIVYMDGEALFETTLSDINSAPRYVASTLSKKYPELYARIKERYNFQEIVEI